MVKEQLYTVYIYLTSGQTMELLLTGSECLSLRKTWLKRNEEPKDFYGEPDEFSDGYGLDMTKIVSYRIAFE